MPRRPAFLSSRSGVVAAPNTRTTFRCAGFRWNPPGSGSGVAAVPWYRRTGDVTWIEGYPLWYDDRADQYRGSVVDLTADTLYDFQLRLAGGFTSEQTISTWTETPRILQTITVPTPRSTAYATTTAGTPDTGPGTGYVKYVPSGLNGAIDLANSIGDCINVKHSYVIIDGFTLANCRGMTIRLDPGVHHVRIRLCDLSGWGTVATVNPGTIDGVPRGNDLDAAIYCSMGAGQPPIHDILIDNCYIHDPFTTANSWFQHLDGTTDSTGGTHPQGPQGITIFNDGSDLISERCYSVVIRNCTVAGNSLHHFNDAIGGGQNFSGNGFPGADSDIYGCKVSDAHDDGIEAEGGGQNLRVFEDYIDNCFTGIASAGCSLGPLYIFRNVMDRSRGNYKALTDTDARGPFGKCGDGASNASPLLRQHFGLYPAILKYGGGKRYFFHNTLLQRTPTSPATKKLGCSYGPNNNGGDVTETVSRNNIWNVYVSNTPSIQAQKTTVNTFTVTIASPAVFLTPASHGLVVGDEVDFITTGALPTGLAVGTHYFVIAAGLDPDNFQVSATPGGAAINTSGTQSGTHTVRKMIPNNLTENSFDYDVRNGTLVLENGAAGSNLIGTAQTPIYATGNGNDQGSSGKYRLDPTSPGYQAGQPLKNFSPNSTPDVGAQEHAAPDMVFGIR